MTTHILEREVFFAPRVLKSHALWKYPLAEKKSYLPSLFLALVLHALVLLGGGAAFVKPAEYAIDATDGGMEIYMVAALPEAVPEGAAVPPVQQPVQPEKKPEMEIPAPEPVQAGEEKPQEKENTDTRVSEDREHVGDGSSPVPGESSTTFSSSGQASAEGKPGYLKNPPPHYPAESVSRGEEGLVLLSVTVDKTGRARSVELKQTSGFSLLDKSALKAVRGWKFNPGKLGFMASESNLVIPIRFRIEDALKSRMR